MSIWVMRAFEEAKYALDDLFGEGYAAANPLLVDRFVQSTLKNDRRSSTTSALDERDGVYSDFVELLSDSLNKGEIAPGVPFETTVMCETVYSAFADAMNIPRGLGFHARAGKFFAKVFGKNVKKLCSRKVRVRETNYRPHVYRFASFDEVVRVFEDNTGVRVIKGTTPAEHHG